MRYGILSVGCPMGSPIGCTDSKERMTRMARNSKKTVWFVVLNLIVKVYWNVRMYTWCGPAFM